MSDDKGIKSLLEGSTIDWPWVHVEGQIYRAKMFYNGVDYEIYSKLVVIDNHYAYEIIEINEQLVLLN